MDIGIVCVPFQTDIGRWGMARGPQAILDAGLIERLEASGHAVFAPIWIDFPNSERTRDTVTNLGRIAARTSAAVRSVLARDGAYALVLEGNCTHALGPMGGTAHDGAAPGVVWFDAHGDMNTMATTTSGMWGGMPYAVALGWDLDDWREAARLREPVRAEAAALVGASDLDDAEIAALESHPILRMDAAEMLAPGVGARWEAALGARADEAAAWYIHLDLDVAGPEVVPAALTPAPHWPPRAHLVEAAAATA
ncbi:MAG TPA: arginase family protein, partial [Ktedonobacterales bacterium]|nr:arginase family protein [Ktedonobacterales bacterium]